MKTSLDAAKASVTLDRLGTANAKFLANYPGDSTKRQPLHTVYGGAQLFKAETTQRLGQLGLAAMERYAPDADAFRDALRLPASVGSRP